MIWPSRTAVFTDARRHSPANGLSVTVQPPRPSRGGQPANQYSIRSESGRAGVANLTRTSRISRGSSHSIAAGPMNCPNSTRLAGLPISGVAPSEASAWQQIASAKHTLTVPRARDRHPKERIRDEVYRAYVTTVKLLDSLRKGGTVGWLVGFEPTTSGTTILRSTC